MRIRNLAIAGLLAVTQAQMAFSAQILGPPIESLQNAADRVRIVIAKAGQSPGPGKASFSVLEALSGGGPDELVLRMNPDTSENVHPGEAYIAAWSYLRRNRGVVGGWEEDPEGPSLVPVIGLGSDALFEATPEMQLLFSPGAVSDPQKSAQITDALLVQMERDHELSRGLVIMELYLRKDLAGAMNAGQGEKLKGVIQTAELSPQHRDILLRAALNVPAESTSPWLAEEFRRLIIRHGSHYDLGSFIPGLVRTAARGLMQAGQPSDVELLDLLLYSNNPGVTQAALEAMDELDAEVALTRSIRALERGWVQGDSRLYLERYIARQRQG